MTYIIAEPCIDVKDRSCVDVCPVDCIHEANRILVIDPEECIDCGACEPECPVEAIFPEGALPENWRPFIRINYAYGDGLATVDQLVENYLDGDGAKSFVAAAGSFAGRVQPVGSVTFRIGRHSPCRSGDHTLCPSPARRPSTTSGALAFVTRVMKRRRLAFLSAGMLAATATVAAAAPSGDVPWSLLRRPLHLPLVAAGSPCPVSRIDRRVPWARIRIFGGAGIGPGPVYPGLGTTSGLLNAVKDTQYGGPWQGQKVFWYIAPTYRGRVLIRGRRLDGAGWLGFNGTRIPKDELRIEPYDTVTWSGQPAHARGIPTAVRALTSGCYAAQIDGKTFSKVVVFTIDLTP